MKINKHLVAWDTIFTIHEKRFKVVGSINRAGKLFKWVIRPLYGGKDFVKEANELDKILRKHKKQNDHLLY
jgi:hypothetical protein